MRVKFFKKRFLPYVCVSGGEKCQFFRKLYVYTKWMIPRAISQESILWLFLMFSWQIVPSLLKSIKSITFEILCFLPWNCKLTGTSWKKISCYMRDSACKSLLLKVIKYFGVTLNTFEFSNVNGIVESWLVYVNKFSWIIQSCFLTETTKRSWCQLLFLTF